MNRTAYYRQYYLDHRDAIRAKRRAWWLANRDLKCEQNRETWKQRRHVVKVADYYGITFKEARALIAADAQRKTPAQGRGSQNAGP